MPQDHAAKRASSSSDESSKFSLDAFQGTTDEIARWKAKVKHYASKSAADCLHSGSHLRRFSDFLHRDDAEAWLHGDVEYAVLYDFAKVEPKILLRRPSDLKTIMDDNAVAKHQSQLLFLRGYPSPGWLAAVGAAFDVDPEFFEHHFRFDSSPASQAANTWPLLSSAAAKEPRLRFATLGYSQDLNEKFRKASHVRELRKRATERHQCYLRTLGNGRMCIGDSLLRGIRVHDSINFSFEQDVSIWTRQTDDGWIAIAWLDFGCRNLADNHIGTDLLTPVHDSADSNVFRPIIFGRLRDVDGGRQSIDSSIVDIGSDDERHPQIHQNALHLWHQYDRGLDLSLARKDSFYALSKLFEMAASSEQQLLNMVQRSVKDNVQQANPFKEDDASMSNLQDNQQELNRHRMLLRQNIAALEKHSTWPRVTPIASVDEAQIDKVASACVDDFRGLLVSVDDIANECNQGVNYLINVANLAESQRAIAQAQGVESLTRLASLFIPLALLAAFFGMNFQELGQGHLRLWIFFAAAGPTFVVSMFCLNPSLRRCLAVGFRRLQPRRKRCPEREIEMGQVT